MAASNSWHRDISTWKERNEFLFNNKIMSDWSFIVGKDKTIIPAHKYVLGGNSEEFYNLFYLMKTSDEIPIEDASVDIFISFLEFLYTEKTMVTMENVGDLLKLAKRYSVDHFEMFCGEFLSEDINNENALSVLDKYSEYKMPSLVNKCAKLISYNELIFETPTFLNLRIKALTELLMSDELKGFKEIAIFNGVNKWSEIVCKVNNQTINSANKRLAIGPALEFIRFPTMSFDEFTSCTLNNPILNTSECMEIYQCIGGKSECKFSNVKRTENEIKKIEIYLRREIHDHPLNINDLKTYFSVKKTIFFHGFGIFGRTNYLDEQNPETLTIQLKDDKEKVVLESVVSIEYDRSQKTYDLMFDEKILLKPNVEYGISVARQIPGTFENYYFNPRTVTREVELFTIRNNDIIKCFWFSE